MIGGLWGRSPTKDIKFTYFITWSQWRKYQYWHLSINYDTKMIQVDAEIYSFHYVYAIVQQRHKKEAWVKG